jgi:hypothetical protein
LRRRMMEGRARGVPDMPNFDTTFHFGANARKKAAATRPKPPRRPKAGKPKGRAPSGAAGGS